ncbi:MAG: DUF4160 domain-containing protein [Methylovirgula sp.]
MPTIAWFFGIAIRMYFRDHSPPHFQAVYNEFEANVSIDHDDFGLKQSKIINVIDFKMLERDASGKPLTLFLIPL